MNTNFQPYSSDERDYLVAERDRLKAELVNARDQALADRAFQSENARLKAEKEELVRALESIQIRAVGSSSDTDADRKRDLFHIDSMARSILEKVRS